jgi:hypothetical protein
LEFDPEPFPPPPPYSPQNPPLPKPVSILDPTIAPLHMKSIPMPSNIMTLIKFVFLLSKIKGPSPPWVPIAVMILKLYLISIIKLN